MKTHSCFVSHYETIYLHTSVSVGSYPSQPISQSAIELPMTVYFTSTLVVVLRNLSIVNTNSNFKIKLLSFSSQVWKPEQS